MLDLPYDYLTCVKASEKASWHLDDVMPEGALGEEHGDAEREHGGEDRECEGAVHGGHVRPGRRGAALAGRANGRHF
mgnify:CR=1 FL=1